MSLARDLRFKVAAVQDAPVLKDAPLWFDIDATVGKAVGLIEEAGANGARLVVFPECWMPAFPYTKEAINACLTIIPIPYSRQRPSR